ncbi:MAG: DNA photolyase family protein [Austwickia sp.]|nr:DNA photolyase family protein [Austwickia sp.]
MPSMLWFRRDLRLRDLPALGAAAAAGGDVVPLVVLDPALLASAGSVRQRCLFAALRALHESCEGRLVVRTGRPDHVLPAVAAECGATQVHGSAESTPYGRARDERVRAALAARGVGWVATGTPYAVGPGTLVTGGGTPYQVFTPFSRAWRDHGWPQPAPVPRGLRWATGIDSEALPADPNPADPSEPALPVCSEAAALERLTGFVAEGLPTYATDRDRPDLRGTSELSMHLKYGTIHPRTVLAAVAASGVRGEGPERFVTELAWREYYADVLWHRPDSAWADLRGSLAGMAYDDPAPGSATEAAVSAWRAGRTGFPFVDAGMRQLLAEGWMHNRVRMVVASFLVKDLHVWWPHGARHFLAHLRDGDIASNNHGWQWVAGTGTDAAPYFRVFNPVTQGVKFDPDGDYVRRYVPELAHLAGRRAHEPWKAADGDAAGYPQRIVDHGQEREEALRRYDAARH